MERLLNDDEIDDLYVFVNDRLKQRFATGLNKAISFLPREQCKAGDEALTCKVTGYVEIDTVELGKFFSELIPGATHKSTLDGSHKSQFLVFLPIRVPCEQVAVAPSRRRTPAAAPNEGVGVFLAMSLVVMSVMWYLLIAA